MTIPRNYQPQIRHLADTPFMRGQLDAAAGRDYSQIYVNCDDRQDYMRGFNAPLDVAAVREATVPVDPPSQFVRSGLRTRRCLKGDTR